VKNVLKILRKRIIKVVPVWLLVAMLLSAGTAIAFSFISNLLSTSVTVTLPPITLANSFVTTQYSGIEAGSAITYTVNSGTPTGYVYLEFLSTSITSLSDITVTMAVNPTGGGTTTGTAYTGYPYFSSGSFIRYLFANGTAKFNFGSTTGVILFFITYNKVMSVTPQVQVTSSYS
jgi:hypothetical protein